MEEKLLQFSTYGMKNIETQIEIDFANSTIENGINKVNNVKGIFGYNGAGKTAIITSVDFYKNILTNPTYLLQNNVFQTYSKMINKKTNEFMFSAIFGLTRHSVVKHIIKVAVNQEQRSLFVVEEQLLVSTGRTINENYKSVFHRNATGEVAISPEYNSKLYETVALKITDSVSFISLFIKEFVNYYMADGLKNVLDSEKLIVSFFTNINNINVYLFNSDKHNSYMLGHDQIMELLGNLERIKPLIPNNMTDIYVDDEIVSKKEYDAYQKNNKMLEKFIKIFKPSLKEIKLIPFEDHEIYHIRKLFVYENYSVEFEFESSGIKQLVGLFTYLFKSANGGIVFIDEIDTNLNTPYFVQLIKFFKKYGKGQLVFTTHNIEAMEALKDQSRAIVVIGEENKLDVWTKRGNRSPKNDYLEGFLPHSPMNVEDFDFVNVFLGE